MSHQQLFRVFKVSRRAETAGILIVAGVLVASSYGAASNKLTDDQKRVLQTFAREFVEITPGAGKFPATFNMGSSRGAEHERPVHQVTMARPFAIAKYEVPQNLYEALMGQNPSRWQGPRNSVEMVSWADAELFCRRCTDVLREQKLIKESEVIRLPTEAEWEYCCRAGTTTPYSFGEKATKDGDAENQAGLLDKYAWHTGNAAGNDPAVGALEPNPWGLYDMHGYLWEYVADAWHADYKGAPADGSGWDADNKSGERVMRGGSWRDPYPVLRSAVRRPISLHARTDAIGFRCVRSTR